MYCHKGSKKSPSGFRNIRRFGVTYTADTDALQALFRTHAQPLSYYERKGMIRLKHHIFSKALSLTAAAVMSWSAVSGTGIMQAAAAQPPAQPLMQQTESSEPVPVIVKVSGDAVMAHPDAAEAGADYLETDAAAELTAQTKTVQRAVQDRIRQIYPELRVGFSYSTLINGFSCELPENLIDQVRTLPDVVSVSRADDIAVPQMDRAAGLSGFPVFAEETGCRGEGQVIAVIDSELDITHPMFEPLADGIETALSREEVTEIINSGALNIEVDSERAYISNKLPYVIDYVDDPYEGVPDPASYHGTHVSGIAAGNTFTAADGTVLSGIAKDAQLMFFGVGEQSGTISEDAALAAIEDAVKLHADVINMSWGRSGEAWEGNPLSDAIFAADRAGVIVCNSAGNYDNGTYSWNNPPSPDNPDSNYMNATPELGSPVLMVASADNTGAKDYGTLIFNGQTVICRPKMDINGSIVYFSDALSLGEYEYVDCGNGSLEAYPEDGIDGRIALVQRGALPFDTIAEYAERRGAAGVILIDKEEPDGMEYVMVSRDIVINCIPYNEGQAMLAAENKVFSVSDQKVTVEKLDKTVSFYSSWGVKNSLDLRPDIMGIGGNVRSAAYAEKGGDAVMSGTSMSSPYVAGCAAVLREYLKKQNVTLSETEFTARVRHLLMNTAYPYADENGLFITPRQQGAGMVALDRAVSAKVLMTGEAGDAKVNLFDQLGDTFSFNVTFTNYSDEDVTFPQAEIRLTTDGTYFDDSYNEKRICLRGQQKLNCTADICGPVTVAAGDTFTVPVTVNLDAAQCRGLEKIFRYGFFAEGYLLLSGAENSADISIPMLGYHGDWTQIPLIAPGTETITIDLGYKDDSSPVSLIRKGLITKEILSRLTDRQIEEMLRTNDGMESVSVYATEEEAEQLQFNSNECWISPNHDTVADRVYGCSGDQIKQRLGEKCASELINSKGEVVFSNPRGGFWTPDFQPFDFAELDEGDYTFNWISWINYEGARERPQISRFTVHIDKTAPDVTSETVEENGRTYLVIRASDNTRLQGISVTGIGFGGEAGVYQPDGKQDEMRTKALSNALFLNYMNKEAVTTALDLPYALRAFIGFTDKAEGEAIPFADILAPKPDASGVWTVKYDVTDLTDYSITVMDEAYNYVEISTAGSAAETLVSKKGTWVSLNEGYYVFNGDHVTYTSYLDGSVTEYSYKADKDKLTLTAGKQTKTLAVKYLSQITFLLTDQKTGHSAVIKDAGTTRIEGSSTGEGEDIDYSRFITKPFHPQDEVVEILKKDFKTKFGGEPVVSSLEMNDPDNLELILKSSDQTGQWTEASYILSIITGRGHVSAERFWKEDGYLNGCIDENSGHLDLFPCYLTKFPAGLYNTYNAIMMLFREDGTGMFLYRSNSFLPSASFGLKKDTPFTYTLDDSGYLSILSDDVKLLGWVTQDPGEKVILYTYDKEQDHTARALDYSELTLITDDPEKLANLHPTEEICKLAAAYINASAGTNYPPSDTLDFDALHNQLVYSQDVQDNGYGSLSLRIDPYTLDVTDDEEYTGNLLNPPEMPDHAVYSLKELGEKVWQIYKNRTGHRPEYVIPFILSNGQIMVRVVNQYFSVVDKYYADPVTGEVRPVLEHRGDVNCDGIVDVADAVLLARFLTEDSEAKITDDGKQNADCDLSRKVDYDDVTTILQVIARLIMF